MSDKPKSVWDWKGEPSKLLLDPSIRAMNHAARHRANLAPKGQVSAFTKAVVAKPRKDT
jgi:hypothetical protein